MVWCGVVLSHGSVTEPLQTRAPLDRAAPEARSVRALGLYVVPCRQDEKGAVLLLRHSCSPYTLYRDPNAKRASDKALLDGEFKPMGLVALEVYFAGRAAPPYTVRDAAVLYRLQAVVYYVLLAL